MADVTVKAYKNGPYEVTGAIELVDFAGSKYQLDENPIYLCRCGQSANKPFCDGTHKKVAFRAEECVRVKAS